MSSQVFQPCTMTESTAVNATNCSYMESGLSSVSSSSSSSSSSSPSSSSSSFSSSPIEGCSKKNMTGLNCKDVENAGVHSPTEINESRDTNSALYDRGINSLFTFPKDSLITPYEHTLSDLDVRLRSNFLNVVSRNADNSSPENASSSSSSGRDLPNFTEKLIGLGNSQKIEKSRGVSPTQMNGNPFMPSTLNDTLTWYQYLFMQSYLQFSANFNFAPPVRRNINESLLQQIPLHLNGSSLWTPPRFDVADDRELLMNGTNGTLGMPTGQFSLLDCIGDAENRQSGMTTENLWSHATGKGGSNKKRNGCHSDQQNGKKLPRFDEELYWPHLDMANRDDKMNGEERFEMLGAAFDGKNGLYPPSPNASTPKVLKLHERRLSAFSSPLTLSARQRKKLMRESYRVKKNCGKTQQGSATVHHVLRWVGKEYHDNVTQRHVNHTSMALPHPTDDDDDEDTDAVVMETMTSAKVYNHRKVAGSKSPLGMPRKKFLMFLGLETVANYMKQLSH